MPITVHKQGEVRYRVAVSPPEGAHWRSPSPMTARQIVEKLSALGCHVTDILDAFHAADPLWTEAYDKDVLDRRQVDAELQKPPS